MEEKVPVVAQKVDGSPKTPFEVVSEVSRDPSALRRTRRSLNTSAYHKALAKQIAVRQVDLNSLLPTTVSVIVRSSTPDPTCNRVHCHQI